MLVVYADGKSKTNLQYNIRKTSTNSVSDDFAYHVQDKNRNYIHGMAFADFHHRNKNPVLSLSQFGILESKLEHILSSSENESNISPLLAISCQLVSTFGIKISQNWKSLPYVKSMGNYIFRVRTGK